jgi:hypothetical protein
VDVRDISGFCERTPEIIEVMEHVFFVGTWPPKFRKQRMHQVSDAVRMQVGVLLVAHGWGTPPNSTDVRISLPQLPPRHITEGMSAEEASRIYAETIRHGHFDDGPLDETKMIDITPKTARIRHDLSPRHRHVARLQFRRAGDAARQWRRNWACFREWQLGSRARPCRAARGRTRDSVLPLAANRDPERSCCQRNSDP